MKKILSFLFVLTALTAVVPESKAGLDFRISFDVPIQRYRHCNTEYDRPVVRYYNEEYRSYRPRPRTVVYYDEPVYYYSRPRHSYYYRGCR